MELTHESLPITEELSFWYELIEAGKGKTKVVMLDGKIFMEARNQIQKLTELGDLMVNVINNLSPHMTEDIEDLLRAWEEIRS
jgi:2-oxoglutarate dehydrogenase complex dehydrogenase (E1) component-like enzyme